MSRRLDKYVSEPPVIERRATWIYGYLPYLLGSVPSSRSVPAARLSFIHYPLTYVTQFPQPEICVFGRHKVWTVRLRTEYIVYSLDQSRLQCVTIKEGALARHWPGIQEPYFRTFGIKVLALGSRQGTGTSPTNLN